ncbi:thioredoxin [Candidatus Woesebacteria bacterium]|nr:thioredoxin [Candidatus Woesebacteria bacterium]
MAVAHITNDSFQSEVADHKGTVLVDFYADWCGPCKATGPIIEALAEEMTDVKFVKVNVDENQQLAGKYSVFSIPTFMVFKDGKMVNQFVGARSKDGFQEEIKKAM